MAEIVERPSGARVQEIAKRFFRHENAVLVLILVGIVAALAVATRGATLTRGNITNIWVQSSSRGIAAIGQTFVLLASGIDISIGGVGLMCAILGAKLMSGQVGFPIVGIGAMLLLGLGIGALNGSLVSRIGMPAVIVTLAMWQVTTGGAYMICRGKVTRFLPEVFAFFGQGYIAGVPVPVIIFLAVSGVAYFVLYHTTFGRSVYAVGGNPVSAWLSGINVKNIQFMVYVISGFLAALVGLIIMSRVMSAGMTTVVGVELDSIAAVVIGGVSLAGGKGTMIGAVIGVLILGILNNGMNVFALDPAYQDVVKGSIIIAAVAIDYLRRR